MKLPVVLVLLAAAATGLDIAKVYNATSTTSCQVLITVVFEGRAGLHIIINGSAGAIELYGADQIGTEKGSGNIKAAITGRTTNSTEAMIYVSQDPVQLRIIDNELATERTVVVNTTELCEL